MAKLTKGIIRRNRDFRVNGSLWIECDGRRFFGPGPAELLEKIQATGSINQAAKQMRMSYKKAWEIINMLNASSARPLVETQTGGPAGGGSVITDEARTLVAWYQQLRERFAGFLEKETRKLKN
jgi:molybdate transport system regulatory protein